MRGCARRNLPDGQRSYRGTRAGSCRRAPSGRPVPSRRASQVIGPRASGGDIVGHVHGRRRTSSQDPAHGRRRTLGRTVAHRSTRPPLTRLSRGGGPPNHGDTRDEARSERLRRDDPARSARAADEISSRPHCGFDRLWSASSAQLEARVATAPGPAMGAHRATPQHTAPRQARASGGRHGARVGDGARHASGGWP